ncbi:hypothetical protein WH47_08771, partial [Habropoda laboriosa]
LFQSDFEPQCHVFRTKQLRKPRPCHLCHQAVIKQASCCRGESISSFPTVCARQLTRKGSVGSSARAVHGKKAAWDRGGKKVEGNLNFGRLDSIEYFNEAPFHYLKRSWTFVENNFTHSSHF